MKYRVKVIGDDDLPSGVDWAYVRQGECLTFCLKRSAVSCAKELETTLENAWTAYRDISDHELLAYPATG